MRFGLRDAIFVVIGLAAFPCAPDAQDVGYFAGAIAGVATLSGDPSFIVTTAGFAVSGYKPENRAAVNVFIGAHLREYVTVQANYIWNRNDLTLASGVASDTGTRFYEQPRASSQHAVVGDLVVHVHGHPQRCDGIADQYAIGRDSGGVGAVAVHHHPHSTERQHPLAGLVGMVPHHAERRVAVDTAG